MSKTSRTASNPAPFPAPPPYQFLYALSRFVACLLGCGVQVQQEVLGDHVDEECILRRTPCEACGVLIALQDMPGHLTHRCIRVPRSCTNGKTKCMKTRLTYLPSIKNAKKNVLVHLSLGWELRRSESTFRGCRLRTVKGAIPLFKYVVLVFCRGRSCFAWDMDEMSTRVPSNLLSAPSQGMEMSRKLCENIA